MTRAWRSVLVVSAVLAIATAAYAQATPYARAPLVADPYAGQLAGQVAAESSCEVLRGWYRPHYEVWRGGVKDRHRAQVEPNHQAMVLILERIGWLEDHGKCGG